jgi:lipopolysaccharide/colanic/teichoic acid biosynthesis glycosyltransferase
MTSLVGALEGIDSADLIESPQTQETADFATVQGRLERIASLRRPAPTNAADISARAQRTAQRIAAADAIPSESTWYLIAKRTIDIIGSVVGLILISPLFAVLAILTKLSDGGPVFYPHTRVGKWGREFQCFKFRTMVVGADHIKAEIQYLNSHDDHRTFKVPDDPRVTRLGRWLRRSSIDEAPQLWSVLRGDMSLVGPRPPVPSEVERYNLDDMQRLMVKPGLTCIWQVSGRSRLPFAKQLEMDLAYIEHRSLWFDVKLMLRTIPAVLSADGAY